MPAKKITLGPSPVVVEYGEPIVSRREHWADEWTPRTDTIALEAVWCCPPAIPTASIRVRYGELIRGDTAVTWSQVQKDNTWSNAFLRLQFPMARNKEGTWEHRTWCGVVLLDEDDLGGGTFSTTKRGTKVLASGVQTFTCYGLEQLLADWPIRSSLINDGGSLNEVQRPLTFNRGGRPNRSAYKILDTYCFESDKTVARFWSTRDIVEYLLENQTPLDSTGAKLVPFKLAGMALPDWDKPEVAQETQSCLSLLTALINRRQMLSWRLVVDEELDEVHVDVFSLAETKITLPITGSPEIAASTRQRSLAFDRETCARASLKQSQVGVYDQVVVRGARMRAVGSFSFADGTLVAGWDSSLQTLYDAGASLATGYAALDDEETRIRNAHARGVPRFEEVYSYLRIPIDWNQEVADGENGFTNPLFPGTVLGKSPVFLGECFVEPTLPLIQGIDYSLTRIADGAPGVADFSIATNLEEMPPLVFFRRPDKPTKWVAADKLGMGGELPKAFEVAGNTRFSVSVQVPHESHGVLIRVQGDPQHAIAPIDFAPLGVDESLGGFDWRDAIVTMSLPFDEHAQGAWPEEVPADLDAPRILVLDAGERYRKHYVAPDTVVDVDRNGALVRSTGGYIPKAGDDDDATKLTAIAKLAHAWFGVAHRVLSLETTRMLPTEELDVGDLITEIGDLAATGGHRATVNTTITEVRLSWPESEGTEAQPPVLQIVTDSGELDPIQHEDDPGRPVKIETPFAGPDIIPFV